MNFTEYQTKARTTALYPKIMRELFPAKDDIRVELLYSVTGLCDEAGEVAGKMKKWLRGDLGGRKPHPDVDDLRKELGDVLWYVAAIASDLDISLESVAKENLKKLSGRKKRGKIRGDGDHR